MRKRRNGREPPRPTGFADPEGRNRRGAPSDPVAGGGPSQQELRPDVRVGSLDEFVAFLEAVEAVVGRDERPRGPTVGERFLL